MTETDNKIASYLSDVMADKSTRDIICWTIIEASGDVREFVTGFRLETLKKWSEEEYERRS